MHGQELLVSNKWTLLCSWLMNEMWLLVSFTLSVSGGVVEGWILSLLDYVVGTLRRSHIHHFVAGQRELRQHTDKESESG